MCFGAARLASPPPSNPPYGQMIRNINGRLHHRNRQQIQIGPPSQSPHSYLYSSLALNRRSRINLPQKCIRFIPTATTHSVEKWRFKIIRCASENYSDSFEPKQPGDYVLEPTDEQKRGSVVEILKDSNAILPHVVLASTLLALIYPPSFTWFTSRYYAPALGFLMFAVGVNSSGNDFIEAFKRPRAILAGYAGQFLVKPLLGYLIGTIAVTVFGLPTSIGAGIMLTSCVSGAQLSNYATFLTDPTMAPLSIVMTSISTASAIFLTPLLSLLLIGKRLPVDVKGMFSSILQIVIAPIAAGLLLNRFFPRICDAIRQFLPPLSVCVTALCVGAPLAINRDSILSPFGSSILLLIIAFHLSAFVAGHALAGIFFRKETDVGALQRTLSYETGMQSSLLALALANKFFQDPLIGVPPAISVVIMALMGFSLVMIWAKKYRVPESRI